MDGWIFLFLILLLLLLLLLSLLLEVVALSLSGKGSSLKGFMKSFFYNTRILKNMPSVQWVKYILNPLCVISAGELL